MTATNEVHIDTRPKRNGMFSAMVPGTIATLSVTCAALGLAALFFERLMARMIEQPSLGALLEWPVPFVSLPLGVGAVTIAASSLFIAPRTSIAPWACAIVYWTCALWMWP